MNNLPRFLAVALGVAAIIWGNFPGGVFFPGGFGISDRSRLTPRWLGRLWFSVFGIGLIFMGLAKVTSLNVQRAIAVILGVAVILNGAATKRNQPAPADLPISAPPVREPFGGWLFVLVGIGFIIGGLLLKR